jgi:hypothetical protein
MTPRLPAPELRRLPWLARPFVRFVYWLCRRKVGRVVQPLQLAAYRPRLLLGVGMMEDGLERSQALSARLKTLASIRVSTRIGCPF